jgi:iron-sulfur cluster repair protein YtfE (RIC family)
VSDLEREQLARLVVLQSIIGAYEVNSVLVREAGDAPYVTAADVPAASQVCSDGTEKYDVWRRCGDKLRLEKAGLDAGAAANVVVMEYMAEKVQRAKRNDPRLRSYSDAALLTHLLKGYQGQEDASA